MNDNFGLYVFFGFVFIWLFIDISFRINRAKKRANEKSKKLKELEETNFPWSKESLRHKYLIAKYDSSAEPFHIPKFICSNPECLKTIIMEKLDFKCPFCNKEYIQSVNAIIDYPGNKLDRLIAKPIYDAHGVSIKEEILFNECDCGGKIQHVRCYHCNNYMDLFEPYNEKELEAKRYVRRT